MSAVIAIDWGSTNLRAYRIVDGTCIDKRQVEKGLINTSSYRSIYKEIIEGWRREPVLLSGMVGSKNGWRETKYVHSLSEITSNLVDVSDLLGRPGWLVPGVSLQHTFCDVMRGEETQLYGLDWDGLVLLPGTHNKWVWMQEKEIVHFKTVMTGEIFGLLQKNGLIGSLMNNEEGNDFNELSFSEGIMVSKERGGLLHQLFSVRARGVQGKSEGLIDYLSGLLIGTELLSQEVCSPLLIIGNERLYARYRRGIELLFPNISIHYESEDTAVIRGANCIWEKFYA